ncbi:hypothetical protein [Kitasatospora cineracea]|uniref:hypothetical protein n=1 Tax=Kitasatospora cineracea TaxID=88074 RepID=UPI0037F31D0F
MPARHDHDDAVPVPRAEAEVSRIGIREVTGAIGRTQEIGTLRVDPSVFQCSTFIAELADEWVAHAELGKGSYFSLADYKTSITAIGRWVDENAEHPEEVSLALDGPELPGLVREWSRALPQHFGPGSKRPYAMASKVRVLIDLRVQREDVITGDLVRRLLDGGPWVRGGKARQLDEFTREEKRKVIRLAWSQVRTVEERLQLGRELLAAAEGHPATHGWHNPANLLWALANDAMTPAEIMQFLPPVRKWPPQLRELANVRGDLAEDAEPRIVKIRFGIALIALLYPLMDDLQGFRVLLVAATGHAPEEMTGLDVDDIEFTGEGVRFTLTKRRARRVRHRLFVTREQSAHTGSGPGSLDVAEITRRLLAVTETVRARSQFPDPKPAFTCASADPRRPLTFHQFRQRGNMARFGYWLRLHGLEISQPHDLRRMRKAVKVEKAIAFHGTVSDIADDHTVQTYRGHYAHGTTLHVIAGRTVNQAQEVWLTKAMAGPVVLDEEAAEDLEEPEALDALGLTRDQAEEIRTGELDMGVTACRDPYDSPFSKAGDLCAVAPLRCMECRNAFILPSNLPQLLLFADHLKGLQNRLPPVHFRAQWGQSAVNLAAVLKERTPAELDKARRHIEEQGLRLQLPLAAYTEFDV